MNLAQEFLLCAGEDDGQFQGAKLPYGFGVAMLADLDLRGRLDLEPEVAVRSTEPTGDPSLDRLLADVSQEARLAWTRDCARPSGSPSTGCAP